MRHVKMLRLVNNFLEQLDDQLGKETPINKSHGQIHYYLGMILDSIPKMDVLKST
jgi:hypothetical protein